MPCGRNHFRKIHRPRPKTLLTEFYGAYFRGLHNTSEYDPPPVDWRDIEPTVDDQPLNIDQGQDRNFLFHLGREEHVLTVVLDHLCGRELHEGCRGQITMIENLPRCMSFAEIGSL